jgi:hypothetical protein
MSKSQETAKRPPGRPHLPEDEQCRKGRFTINLPPYRVRQLRAVAERQGLAISAFMRQAVLTRLDEIDRAG